jgi:hypothetical protein
MSARATVDDPSAIAAATNNPLPIFNMNSSAVNFQ